MNNKIIILLLAICLNLNYAFAQKNLTIIRDDEIESSISKLIEPLFIAAAIDPNNMRVVIVDDPTINAFVANQTMVFIHSGLLIKFYDDPDIVLGVVAHELGHILGGHLAKLDTRYRNIAENSIASAVILGAIGFAMAAPELAIAGINGSMHIGKQSMLSYSRQQEQSADKIAVELLEKSKNSPIGLKKIMDYFRQTDVSLYGKINPYAITHPMPAERLQFITNYIEKTKYPNSMIASNIKNKYIRAVIKLSAFLEPNQSILLSKVENDRIYAKSIINFRTNHKVEAIKLIDQLIQKEANNPYFYELKAQILFENGNITDALAQYQKSYALEPSNLITYEYGAALIEAVDMNKIPKNKLNEAIILLKKPNKQGSIPIENLDQLARAYGKKGQIGMANYYLAKMYVLLGDEKKATRFAKIASRQLPKSDPYHLKAMDIYSEANQ
jgi:predicted Zn-dependent protease